MLLLDTCALLWLAEGGKHLSSSCKMQISAAPVVYLSAISGFEIGLKHRSGKLKLPALPVDWLKFVVDHHSLTVLPLTLDICAGAVNLPAIHSDPCDRFIIATAMANGLKIVTSDSRFKDYGVEVIL